MKKAISLFLITVILLICCTNLFSCDIGTSDGTSTTANQASCSHSYKVTEQKATCTNGGYKTLKCSLCGQTSKEYESSLGHTTTNGRCTRCGETIEVKVWETSFYVDEFQNPTNEAYMRNRELFVGVFSNSATTNSKLTARILIDADDIAIKMWEYGSYEVNAYSTTYYDITLLDDDGNKYYTTGTMYKNGDRIYFKDLTFITLLQQNTSLKVYISEDSKYGFNSTYLFEVTNGNFNSQYSSFFQSSSQ